MTITIQECGMAAPDIIHLTLREPRITKGNLVELVSADAGTSGSIQQRTNPRSSATEYCVVGGRDNKFQRFFDTPQTDYLDRSAVLNASNYPTIGGLTVTAVYMKCKAYDYGFCDPSGTQFKNNAFEFQLFLKLSGRLAEGSYAMSITGNAFPAFTFTYTAKSTISRTIHATHVGHRPADGDKVATLSVWIPGYGSEHGAVDVPTAYGLTTFSLINEATGAIAYTGNLVLNTDWNDVEDANTLQYYPSTTTARKTLTAITKANPGVVTCASHGFSNGNNVLFRGIGGMTQLEGKIGTVTVVNTNSFSIGIDTSAYSTYVSGTYATHDSEIWTVVRGNRALTYVYNMDYSSFTTGSGYYRIYVPGLGCSNSFRIDPAIHYEAAKVSMKGYYNRCLGIAHDSAVGGWTDTAIAKPGTGGFLSYETLMPISYEYEDIGLGVADSSAAGAAPYITANAVTAYGGFADAGDNDFALDRHCSALYALLDLGYERLPSAARATIFGFPRAKDTFSYTAIYDGIDTLPDVIHMVIHYLEPFRYSQKASGSVYGGFGYYDPYYYATRGDNVLMPLSKGNYIGLWYAADMHTTYYYVMVAAKLSKQLNSAGYTSLASTWLNSAIAAWDWVDAIWSGYASSGIASSAWIAHYITYLGFKVKSGMSDAQLTTHFNYVKTTYADDARAVAAACLWSASGSSTYKTIADSYTYTGSGTLSMGAWEYLNTAGADATKVTNYTSSLVNYADNQFAKVFPGGISTYRYHGQTYLLTNQGAPSILAMAFLLSTQSESSKYLKLLHAGASFYSGANQENLCCTIGLGKKHPESLVADRMAWGLTSEQFPGITPFTWFNFPGTTDYPGGTGGGIFVGNFAGNYDAPTTFMAENSTGSYEASGGSRKLVEPYWEAWPTCESHWPNPYCIYQAEFTTQNQIVGRFLLDMFRHAWDGNTTTSLTAATTRVAQAITH